ncbi:hypothetical protein ACOL3A_07890 [Aliarcobacter butzleri]
MISPIQPNKTYGILHTDSYFSFIGFAKKIESDETQKIDIYLDDKLIDTIEANEFIQKIDDIYDVENKAFSYNLPFKYIDGAKHQVSFKNHSSQDELLNSPYTLINKNHEDFNQTRFILSLEEPISEELKNMYKPNNIGFLATKENLEDEEFVGYIKELVKKFPTINLKGFHFSNINFKKYNLDFKIEFIQIDNIYTILKNIEFYVHNFNNKKNNIMLHIRQNSTSIFSYYFIKDLKKQTLKDADLLMINSDINYIKNPEQYGFSQDEIYLAQTSPHKLIFNHFMNKSGINNYSLDLNKNRYEFAHFTVLDYIINIKDFKKNYLYFLNQTSIKH